MTHEPTEESNLPYIKEFIDGLTEEEKEYAKSLLEGGEAEEPSLEEGKKAMDSAMMKGEPEEVSTSY